ncbi:MAG: dTDP-4-dehydrorhamnose reductase [Nitrospinae bacterium]|nr:dTDP-4-dehydrorhamnose reductase [Nitrospinota bacterium]
MRLVVTGAGGMLGQALGRVMDSEDVDYRPYPLSALDVTDRCAVEEALGRERPDWVIHAAGFTRVDDCESDPERAFAVNVEGARHVADAASAVGARVLYVSTDYVFDGRKSSPYKEEDEPAPLNVYGESKLGGEMAVQGALPAGRWVIVRTAWLYGEGGRNFVDRIIDQAEAGRTLTVVDDQVGNPTWTVELARAIQVIIEAQVAGIYHVVSGGLASWFELAKEILRLTGTEAPLEAIKTEALEQSARRPAYSVLDTTKFQRDTGVTLEAWQGTLALYLVGRRLVAGMS